MEKSGKKIAFNRKAVGEVTRSGGFSALVKEAEAGTVTVLYKFNEPVAIILPCDRTMEMAYELSAGAGVFIADAQKNNTPEGMMERFYRSLIESAALAKIMLGLESGNALEQDVMRTFEASYKKNSAQDKPLSLQNNMSDMLPEGNQEQVSDTDTIPVSRKKRQPRKKGIASS